MPAPVDAIYLSPHLDDAVLSCGGQIFARCARGERVLVVTVFAGDEPRDGLSDLAREIHDLFGGGEGLVAGRRDEDRAAVERLGATPVQLAEREAIYRLGAGGAPLYPDFRSLFRGPRADDEAHARLARALAELPPAGSVIAPLAVGGHVDHALIRSAAEGLAAPLWHYEDYPYVERWRALGRALGRRRDWVSEVLPLNLAAFEAKIEAITFYGSQLQPLFGTEERLQSRLERFTRKVGGERLWRRRAARAMSSYEVDDGEHG